MVPHNLDVFTNACIHSPNPNHLSSTTFLTPKMELEKPYTRLSHVSDTCISEQPKEIACFTPNMGFYVGPWGLLSSNKEPLESTRTLAGFSHDFIGEAQAKLPNVSIRIADKDGPGETSRGTALINSGRELFEKLYYETFETMHIFCGEPISRQINLCISYCNVCNAFMSIHFLQPRCALLQVC